MKKSLFLVAVMAVLGVATAVAQPRAIGANLGYGHSRISTILVPPI